MHHNSKSFKKFKEYKAEVENHRGKSIKSLRSDRGGKYLLGEFRQYLEDHGITFQMSASDQLQYNGVAERKNRSLLDMVRSMMSYASLPDFFWGYTLETTQYILNLVPTKAVSATLKELWNG